MHIATFATLRIGSILDLPLSLPSHNIYISQVNHGASCTAMPSTRFAYRHAKPGHHRAALWPDLASAANRAALCICSRIAPASAERWKITMYKRTALAAAVAVALMNPTASAQQSDDDSVDEIIVSAEPLGRDAESLTTPARVLDEDDLMFRAGNSIGETLVNEPGLSSTYFGPVAGRPIIRGQDGPRIAVLSSGIGTMDVADLSPDHAVPVEPLFLEQVEILRGPATLLYGSTAAGGVVNVVDGKIPLAPADEPVSGKVEARLDSVAETQALAARLDGGQGSFAWHLGAFTRESEDIDIDGFATAGAAERPPEEQSGTLLNSYGEADGAQAGVAFFGNAGNFGIAISTYNTTYGLPGPGEEEEEEEGGEEEEAIFPGPFIDLEQTRIDLRGELNLDGAFESLKVRVGINDYEHVEVEPSGEPGTVFENEAVEARIEAVHQTVAGWRGAIGLQLTDRDFSAVGAEAFIEPTSTQSLGLFILEEREVDFGKIELGARIENTEHDSEFAGAPTYDETAISLSGGLIWELSENYDLNVNLSRSERNLDAAELYAFGPHLATGLFEEGLVTQGIDPEQEVSFNLDVALHYHSDDLTWKIGVFNNDLSDYTYAVVTNAIEDGLPVATFIQEDATLYGIEAEMSWAISDQWWLTGLADFVHGDADSGDLPRIQAPRLGASLGYTDDAWRVQFDAIHHFEQDNVSSFNTDSFTMVNASASRNFLVGESLELDVFLRATNLLDEAGRRPSSFRAAFVTIPGTNFELGVRASF